MVVEVRIVIHSEDNQVGYGTRDSIRMKKERKEGEREEEQKEDRKKNLFVLDFANLENKYFGPCHQ